MKWFTIKEFVDVDTGEVLTEAIVKNNYIIIKQKKHVTIKEHADAKWGQITWTSECRSTPQQKLFRDDQ